MFLLHLDGSQDFKRRNGALGPLFICLDIYYLFMVNHRQSMSASAYGYRTWSAVKEEPRGYFLDERFKLLLLLLSIVIMRGMDSWTWELI